MKMGCKHAIAGLAGALLSTIGATAAIAQDVLLSPAPVRSIPSGAPLEYYNSILDEFDDAYFSDDRDFYKNRTFPRQLDWVFGIDFPDREMSNDGREVNQIYREMMARQMASGPIIRVFDLPSPFCQTLRTLPPADNCGIIGCGSVGCSLSSGIQPIAPPVITPVIPPAVEAPPPVVQPPQQNVPALW